MKTTPTILIGHPLLGYEAAFLRTLCSDLAGHEALIIANFVVGSSRQIDFVVVTPTNAVLIELKNYHHAVFGQMNGAWTVRDPAGNMIPDRTHNLWDQTLKESFALSDSMERDQRRKKTAPKPAAGYYKLYSAYLCFYPDIPVGSSVTRGDHRAHVAGYADVLAAIKNNSVKGWSIPEWEAFAKRALGVTPATLEAAVDARVLAGQTQLTAYRLRLESILGTGLAPMLDSDGDARAGLDVIHTLQGPLHYLLHGPSGSAKTFHLHHLALALAADTCEMPFLVEAKRHRGGEFRPYFRQALAPFFSGDPEILLGALKDCGRTPVLLIDALNECAEDIREELLHGALAFALQFEARIIMTAQDARTPLAGVYAEPVALALPRNAQKRHIYAFHAGIDPAPEIDPLCAGFETAYDLKLAGRCHATGNPPGSRADLYDRYIATALPTSNAFMAAALLRHIAGSMHDTLSIALTRRTYDELAERFLTQNDAKLSVLDALSETRLIDLTADSFSFEHELLLTYLEAEHLRRQTLEFNALAAELAKPRNAQLLEFILPRIPTSDERARLIGGISDLPMLERILAGNFGTDAQSTLRDVCGTFIGAAIADVATWTVDLATTTLDDGTRRLASVDVAGDRTWTPAEERLAQLLPATLRDPELQSPALRLLDESESALRDGVRSAADAAGFRFNGIWSEAIRFHGGILGHPRMLPCATMLVGLNNQVRPWDQDGRWATLRAAMLERATAVPPSDFALHYVLNDHAIMASHDRIAENLDLLERTWHTGVPTHRMEVLHAFRSMRFAVTDIAPEMLARATAILDTFTSTNVWLDSMIFETKSIFEAVPPPVSLDEALSELRACFAPDAAHDESLAFIAKTENTSVELVLAGQAYHLIGRIFEDVFQGTYYEAYQTLDDDERLALLSVAARHRTTGFHTAYILRELMKCDRPETAPLFAAHLEAVDFTSGFLQDEVSAARIAIEACARWSDTPPHFGTTTPEYAEAFTVIGEALFAAHRADATATDMAAIRAKWGRLTDEERLAAGAILRSIKSATMGFEPFEHDAHADLLRVWPEEIEAVMLDCIVRRAAFNKAFSPHNFHGDLITHAIDTVGNTGSARSLPVLRALSEDRVYGGRAVAALASLQRRGVGLT